MIGQEKLLNTISKYTLATMPKTLLFIGDSGCGKHTLAKIIADQLSVNLEEITTETTPSELINFQLRTIPYLYLINLTTITEKQQNQFLKFVEEPNSNVYIILIAENEFSILPTILSRCIKFKFEEYSAEQLKQLNFDFGEDTDLVFSICNTPGQLLNTDFTKIKAMQKLCNAIFENILKAPYPNIMSISTKFNYKEDYNKFEPILFIKLFTTMAYNKYIENPQDSFYLDLGNYGANTIKDLTTISASFNENIILEFLSGLQALFR